MHSTTSGVKGRSGARSAQAAGPLLLEAEPEVAGETREERVREPGRQGRGELAGVAERDADRDDDPVGEADGDGLALGEADAEGEGEELGLAQGQGQGKGEGEERGIRRRLLEIPL